MKNKTVLIRPDMPRAVAIIPEGMNKAPRWLSYEQAKAWVQSLGHHVTSGQVRKRIQEGLWPSNIPTNLSKTYPEFNQLGGWRNFSRNEKKVEILSYEKTKEWARQSGIKNAKEWKEKSKQKEWPPEITRRPERTYAKLFEKDGRWGTFLGTGRLSNNQITYVSYDEASSWAQEKGINTVVEWLEWQRQHKNEKPQSVPAAPANVYPDFVERGGWNAFLGTRKLSGTSASERVLAQELANVISEKVETGFGIKLESGKEKNFDLVIPEKNLVIEYDGWFFHQGHIERDENQTEWLKKQGWKVVRIREIPLKLLNTTYDLFIDKKLGFFSKCVRVFTHLEMLGFLEQGTVEKYEDKGKLWSDITNLTCWKTYEEASEWFIDQSIKNGAEWKKWQKENTRPTDIPACPNNVYENWVGGGGWGGFTGSGHLSAINTKKRYEKKGYEAVREWFRDQGIKTVKHWNQWQKENTRPKDIPSCPQNTFAEQFTADGGWPGFLNSGFLSNHKRVFLTYDEAKIWFKEKEIKNGGKWTIWKKENIRPDNIPANPDLVYKEFQYRGGWPGFLDNVRPIKKIKRKR